MNDDDDMTFRCLEDDLPSAGMTDARARSRAHTMARRVWGPAGKQTDPARYWESYRRALEELGRSDLAEQSREAFRRSVARRVSERSARAGRPPAS